MALTKVTQHSLGNSAVTTAKLGTAPFGFANSSANVVYMAANGNVGIGTTSPAAKLDVNGSIKSDNLSGLNAIINGAVYGNRFFDLPKQGSWLQVQYPIGGTSSTQTWLVVSDGGKGY